MNNLGYYYEKIEKKYDLMKKYYMMVISNGREVDLNNWGNSLGDK
jgi:hypothetical protein